MLAVRRSVTYFFAPNSPIVWEKWWRKDKKRDNYEGLCFQANTIKIKNCWEHSLVPSLPSRNNTLVIAAKNYAETDIKVS